MKKTHLRILALAMTLLLSAGGLISCTSMESGTSDTVNGTDNDTLSGEEEIDYSIYSIAGATTAYPNIPSVMTITSSTGATYEVSYDEYRYYQLLYKDYFDGGDESYWTSNPEMVARVKKLIVDEIVRNYAIHDECARYSLSLTEEELSALDNETAELVSQFGSIAVFDEALAQYNMTEYFYNLQTVYVEEADKLNDYYCANGTIITDESELRGLLNTDEFVRCKFILIMNDVGDTSEDNLALINTIYDRLNGGEDFETLMVSFSEEQTEDSLQNGYYFFRGEMEENIDDAAFALSDGEYSGIIETTYGYQILMRYPKENTYIDENFSDIKNDYLNLRFYQILDDLTDDWTVTYCENYATYEDWNNTVGG